MWSRRGTGHAIEAGIDPDFIEQLFRVLLTETHRIEVAGKRPDPAPEKQAASGVSALDTVASRIDHLVIAVEDADAVASELCDRLGFHRRAESSSPAVVAVGAGGVELILVGRDASAAAASSLDRHGPGVRSATIEVLNAGYARASIDALGAVATDVLVDADGHEQFFVVDDGNLGVSLGFLSRTGIASVSASIRRWPCFRSPRRPTKLPRSTDDSTARRLGGRSPGRGRSRVQRPSRRGPPAR